MNTTTLTDIDKHSPAVWDFFGQRCTGVFVDVGANHPTRTSLTAFLEAKGWRGILIEPNPNLCVLLREQRQHSQTFQTAVGNQKMVGELDLLLGISDLHSTLTPINGDPLSGQSIRVTVRTLDDILQEAGAEKIDFMSLDIEGMELEALQGLNLQKYKPELILVEDKHHHFKKYFHLRRAGYRLVKRTDLNDWYVPENSPHTIRSLNPFGQRIRLFRKMWINAPCDNFYKGVRRKIFGKRK